MTEKQLQAEISRKAKELGWKVIRPNPSGGCGSIHEKGIPDLMLVKPGVMVLLEVKLPGGKLRPAQVEFFSTIAGKEIEPGYRGGWVSTHLRLGIVDNWNDAYSVIVDYTSYALTAIYFS